MITSPSGSEKSVPLPTSGITFDVPEQQEAATPETIVIPSGQEEQKNPPSFSNAPPQQTNPWPKQIIILLFLLLILGGALYVGRMIFGVTAENKETTITYWGLWESDAIIKPVIAAFEAKNPKIKINYVKQSQTQYRERLQAAIARGEGPDVFRFHNTWVPMIHNELSAVPETVMSSSEFQNTFYPVAANDLIAGTTIYGIPLEIDGLGLYYNEDLFAKAGITAPPTTWEELLNIVPKITKASGDTFIVSAIALGTTTNVEHYSDIVATMFMQNGAAITAPKGAEAEQTLQFYRKFSTPNDPLYTWNETMDNSIYAFAMGKVAMILAPSWRAFDVVSMNPNLRFKIAPTPQLPGNIVNWASYWVEGVSSQSKYQAQAWEFVKYLTSKEGATLLYSEAQKARKLFGEPYARIDMAPSIKDDPYVGAYIKQATGARSFPLASRTFDNGINDKLIAYLMNAINSLKTGSSPTDALDTMSAGFKQVFVTYGLVSNAPAQQTQ